MTVEPVTSDGDRPVKRVTARAVTLADLVADAMADHPDGKPAFIATVAGVSESTARRHMARLSPSAA